MGLVCCWHIYGPVWAILYPFLNWKKYYKRTKIIFWFQSKELGAVSVKTATGKLLRAEIIFWIKKYISMIQNYLSIKNNIK
jgi:hypothetical protein